MDRQALLDTLGEYLELDDDDCLSLPRQAYLSNELYELEVERIFRREWLCVGREEYIPAAGDYYCLDVLDEPLLVVRGDDHRIRILSSVCRHRYMPVAEGRGNTKRFVCPYHAWTYATDGALVAAPYMRGSRRFDLQGCRLPEYRCESWCGFLFVNLDDDAPPLAPRFASMARQVANYRIDEQVEVLHYEREWAGNWKLSAENSMEYYHHVGLHKDTVQEPTPAKNTYLPPPPADLSFTHERCGMAEEFRDGGHALTSVGRLDTFDEEELRTAYMVYVFPAFTMAMRPNSNNWLSFRPAGPENTQVLGGYLVAREVLADNPEVAEQRRELIYAVNEEDSRATTELARVMRSSKAARGPLGPFEGTIAQFYRYLARTLTTQRDTARSHLRSA